MDGSEVDSPWKPQLVTEGAWAGWKRYDTDPFENLTSYEWGEGRKNRTENCFGLACQEYPLAPAMLTRVRQLTAPLRSRLCNWL